MHAPAQCWGLSVVDLPAFDEGRADWRALAGVRADLKAVNLIRNANGLG